MRIILETYAGRWGIEVFFREAKHLLGFADSHARKEAAVLRVAPLVGLLYSTLVLWFGEGVHRTPLAAPPLRPWYPHKVGLRFADVHRATRRTLDASRFLFHHGVPITCGNSAGPHATPGPAASKSLYNGEGRV